MEILVVLLIIISVIGSLANAASKAKKKQQVQSGAQPPRPTMSDIQRAFMMMTGLDDEQDAPDTSSRPQSAAPPPASAAAPAKAFSEGSSDFGTARPGSIPGYTPPVSLDYTPLKSGSLDYTPLTREGQTDYTFAAESISESAETVTELQESLGEVYGADLSESDAHEQHRKAPPLKLFANQGDYVRAVIYSEILSRRARGRRA